MTWDFDTGTTADTYTLLANQTLVLVYELTVDTDVAPSQTLSNSAQINDYFSTNNDADPSLTASGITNTAIDADRESFGSSLPVVVSHTTPAPGDLAKVVDVTEATIGESVTYTITVPAVAVGAQLFDVVVTDQLPTNVSFVSAAFNGGGAVGALVSTDVSGATSNTFEFSGFDIPAGQQAIIDVVTRVNNTADEDAGDSFQNLANYTYEIADGGTDDLTGGVDVRATAVTIIEPIIAATKLGQNITTGGALSNTISGDAGDIIEYQIAMVASTGANFSDAFDVEIVDTMPADASFVAGSASIDGGQLVTTDPTTNIAQVLTWSDSGGAGANSINITEGSTVTLSYRVLLGDGIQAGQTLINDATITWDSLENEATNDRDSGGGIDDYSTDVVTPVTLTVPNPASIAKSVADDDAAVDNGAGNFDYRVGEILNYSVVVSDIPEGTSDNFTITDTLPAGLEFASTSTVTANAAMTAGGANITTIAPSTAGSPEVITWAFGSLVNTGNNAADNSLTINYTVLITDAVALGDLVNQTNTAEVSFDVLAGNEGTATSTFSANDTVDVDIPQPLFNVANLTKTITASTVPGTTSPEVVSGEVVTFQLEACNLSLIHI